MSRIEKAIKCDERFLIHTKTKEEFKILLETLENLEKTTSLQFKTEESHNIDMWDIHKEKTVVIYDYDLGTLRATNMIVMYATLDFVKCNYLDPATPKEEVVYKDLELWEMDDLDIK